MEKSSKKITLYDIVAIGLMAAFVFIATFFFKIKIPTPGGSTMVKLGNGICLLCGTLLGGWRGGLAAGFGCALFDLTDPEYAPTAYITFIRYFIMAGLCGFISHWHGANGRKTGRDHHRCIHLFGYVHRGKDHRYDDRRLGVCTGSGGQRGEHRFQPD